MMRKRILNIVAALTIVVGLAQFWSFFSPLLDPDKPDVVNPVLAIIGVLYLLAGWGIFGRNEIGLDLSFWLWFLGLVWSLLSIGFFLGSDSDFAVTGNMLLIIFSVVWITLSLFVVIFVSQKETKKMFAHKSAEDDIEGKTSSE
jgi:hypothetical protein